MGSYVGLVMNEVGQEFINLLESSASIKGADVECLLIRHGYGGERCICSFHFVVCFKYGLLLRQFCVAPYMSLRSLQNVPGRLHIPKSCQWRWAIPGVTRNSRHTRCHRSVTFCVMAQYWLILKGFSCFFQ